VKEGEKFRTSMVQHEMKHKRMRGWRQVAFALIKVAHYQVVISFDMKDAIVAAEKLIF
jgi:hypothetical protein